MGSHADGTATSVCLILILLTAERAGRLKKKKKRKKRETQRESDLSFIYEDKCQQSGTASPDGRCRVAVRRVPRSSILSAGDRLSLPGYNPRDEIKPQARHQRCDHYRLQDLTSYPVFVSI